MAIKTQFLYAQRRRGLPLIGAESNQWWGTKTLFVPFLSDSRQVYKYWPKIIQGSGAAPYVNTLPTFTTKGLIWYKIAFGQMFFVPHLITFDWDFLLLQAEWNRNVDVKNYSCFTSNQPNCLWCTSQKQCIQIFPLASHLSKNIESAHEKQWRNFGSKNWPVLAREIL